MFENQYKYKVFLKDNYSNGISEIGYYECEEIPLEKSVVLIDKDCFIVEELFHLDEELILRYIDSINLKEVK